MTIASLGRSMKMDENMGLSPFEACRRRRSLDRLAGAGALNSFHDDLLAAVQALIDDNIRPAFTACLDPLDHRLAVFDHKDVDAFLIRDQRRLRDHHLFLRFTRFDRDADQLTVDQLTIWVRYRGACQHRISRAVYRNIEKIDRSLVLVS